MKPTPAFYLLFLMVGTIAQILRGFSLTNRILEVDTPDGTSRNLAVQNNQTRMAPSSSREDHQTSADPKNKVRDGDETNTFSPPSQDIPVVIISSLRPDYLEKVLRSLSQQHPNTPSWIANSPRYVFAHKNKHTDHGLNWEQTQQVAKKYGGEMHVFEGLTLLDGHRHPKKPIRAYHTKHTWYRMMRYLFQELNQTEVLILEDDAVLAPDGLLMAAALFKEKHRYHTTGSDTIHNIALGGWAGSNKVNADPYQYMAVRSKYLQAMAYSMDVELFSILNASFKRKQMELQDESLTTPDQVEGENNIDLADWTMEITIRNFVGDNLTQLEPSVGRMHHIGVHGMGSDGNGTARGELPIPWRYFQSQVRNSSKAIEDMYMYPNEVTDSDGYVCHPPGPHCSETIQSPQEGDSFGKRKVHWRSKEEKEAHFAKLLSSKTKKKKKKVKSLEPRKGCPLDIPVVVISSLHPINLKRVLKALSQQHPNTPSWIADSPRYVFAHKNKQTDQAQRWERTEQVATNYGMKMHVFADPTLLDHHPRVPIQAYHTKDTWHRMMRYLFQELNHAEVLILEDDAVLAPDGLLMAAALFNEKHRTTGGHTIHNIALGGYAGFNKVKADPYQYMAVRSQYLQATAYSMDAELFTALDATYKKKQLDLQDKSLATPDKPERDNTIDIADRTTEISSHNFISNLTQVKPSVGRVHHIEVPGMVPWSRWQSEVKNSSSMMEGFYLYPKEVTTSATPF